MTGGIPNGIRILREALEYDVHVESKSDAEFADRCLRDDALAALDDLWEVVVAAHGAAILTYDPSKTDAQNDEYQRRAERLNKAFEQIGLRNERPKMMGSQRLKFRLDDEDESGQDDCGACLGDPEAMGVHVAGCRNA